MMFPYLTCKTYLNAFRYVNVKCSLWLRYAVLCFLYNFIRERFCKIHNVGYQVVFFFSSTGEVKIWNVVLSNERQNFAKNYVVSKSKYRRTKIELKMFYMQAMTRQLTKPPYTTMEPELASDWSVHGQLIVNNFQLIVAPSPCVGFSYKCRANYYSTN